LLPSVVAAAASTVAFQRSAAYVLPRTDHEYSPAELRRFERDPEHIARTRSRLFWDAETGFAARITTGPSDPLAALCSRALDHLAAHVTDGRLRSQLTPTYEIGCKRVLFSSDYYPALSSDSVSVEPALNRVDGRAVYAENGSHHDLDVLILATGFESARPPFAQQVIGRDGQILADHWRNGMTAYASTAVHGFPNLFIIDGPNASLGHNSAVFMIETQVEYILGALAHLHTADATVLEVSAEAEAAYVAELDRAAGSTVWLTGGCDSWYVDPLSRRLTLLWPDFAHTFRQRLGTFDPQVYRPS
jgi:cation diffusion facilitator CzcD-associated flavoprotein CzcO